MKVLFVPGFQENFTSRDYRSVLNAMRERGYDAQFVLINWTHTTLDDWAAELREIYAKCDPRETILAGFSFGSLTALQVASEQNPRELWLFSLSPYFAEDLPEFKISWRRETGKKRMANFAKLNFFETVARIHCPVLLMAGEIEMHKYGGIIGRRFAAARAGFANVRADVVAKTDHDVTAPAYVAKIKENI
jgi:pimeloyl-ACP methyl ester carboxylesterase